MVTSFNQVAIVLKKVYNLNTLNTLLLLLITINSLVKSVRNIALKIKIKINLNNTISKLYLFKKPYVYFFSIVLSLIFSFNLCYATVALAIQENNLSSNINVTNNSSKESLPITLPIIINITVSKAAVTISPNYVVANTPFTIHVINEASVPIELENADTSSEIYPGIDKTFKLGLDKGKYEFFDDFNPSTKSAFLYVQIDPPNSDNYNQNSGTYNQNSDNISMSKPIDIIKNGSDSRLSQIIFIMWRESVEALLVVAVVFGWIKKLERKLQNSALIFLSLGIVLGVATAIVVGITLKDISTIILGTAQIILQASLTFTAMLMLLYMIKWMRTAGRNLKNDMYNNLNKKGLSKWNISILLVVAIAIAREGSEAVVFIYALGVGQYGVVSNKMLLAACFGVGLAIITIYLLQLTRKFLSWKYFFRITEVLLLLLGSSFVLNSIDMISTSGILPSFLSIKLWDSSNFISAGGFIEPLLNAIIGYRPTPSLIELLCYIIYWMIVFKFVINKR